mgnify:CR=1 FL=1
MKQLLMCSAALVVAAAPTIALAQSTGSQDFEDSIIVTGAQGDQSVGGVKIPETPKAKVMLDQEIIARQRPGQAINETLNLVPGVSFSNQDPWGSLGGSFTVRGFSSDRVSQTIDGIPLNDSGNYALYTNQQLDPEIIEAATVSLGSTDVDSPTASAAGGTINIRSLMPSDEMGAMISASYGNIVARGNDDDRAYHRIFGMFQTGVFTPFGTKAWFSASRATNKSTYTNYGGVDKQQYNGKIYQPIGSNGDFIALAGHYNQNRNTFNGSTYTTATFPGTTDGRFYDTATCTVDTPQTGVTDYANSCGSAFERRYNPSNTGNVRLNSRFTLANGLTLTVDPSFQYTKANGGGTSYAYEGASADGNTGGYYLKDSRNTATSSSTQYYYVGGVDLNGDGDTQDFVRVLSPSQTVTKRYGVIANLSYDIDPDNRLRLSYTYDRARHRQTGEAGYLEANGDPVDVFPINNPIVDADGNVVQKRNRLSYATLNQISGEYRGSYLDDQVILLLGARMPFFSRDLNQYCVTTDASGNVNCPATQAGIDAQLAANSAYAAPQSRKFDYNKLLPNLGVTYKFTSKASVFTSYAKNLSVPGTDALYGALYFDEGSSSGNPKPETSDAFDLGLRYQSGIVQAQLSGWYTRYNNRLATAYDADCDCSVTRNLGRVDKYGVDGSVAVRPVKDLMLYVFGSYLKSEIKDDVQTGASTYAATAGKREAGAPVYTLGSRIQGTLGPVDLGLQIKRTGERYVNDINTVKLPGYTLVDLDARFSLERWGLKKTFFQLNVTNLFDKVYIGYSGTGLTSTATTAYLGSPRALSGSMVVAF